MVNLNQFKLTDILTPNLLADENIRNAAESIDAEMQAIASAAERLPLLANLDSLHEQWLDELLWQFHVEGVEFADTLEEKRALIRNSIEIHRTKGTRYALERVLEILNMRGIISEWWEHGGDPFTFRIDILEVRNGLTEERIRLLDRLVQEYKNTRSWLESIRIYLTTHGSIYFAAAMTTGETITVYPWTVEALSANGSIHVGSGMQSTETITVYPAQ
ncbi:phage tail protein I [Brevibacillus sp. MER 51]|uniref:phage tail protein I n=1 Tax=Brevibacillus sp. MER 51 TaxID=2939560 RepID=UPI00203EBE9A|nr:phage tail protein I [Brevibacillus sp. MER 51]MCM3141293.1 phage tail protein I [Brevibacillus sp. MER 51]